MQFTSSLFALVALSIGGAFAQTDGSVTVHVVTVGNMNGSLTFTPNKLTAAKGSMVQFQFAPKNHSVVQSNFDNPCSPISEHTTTSVGIFSGYMPVASDATSIPTYTIMVNATTPLWIYCSQGKHCQSGMSMVINENTGANATRSLENYQAAAKNVASSSSPATGTTNGTDGTTTASGTSTSTSSSTASASGSKSTNAAAAVRVSQAAGFGAVVAAVFALL